MHNQEEPVAVRAVDHWLAAVPAEHEHFDRPADYPRDHLGRIIATSHRHDRAWQQVWSSVGRQPYGYPASAAIMEDDDEMEEDVHLTASVLLATDREEDEKGDEFLMTSPPAASLLPRSNANWGASLVALLANNNNANNNNDSHNNNNNSNHSHNDLRYYHRRPSMMASHYDARGRGYGGNETIPVDIDQSINAWYADSAANEEDYLSKEMSALFPDGTLDKQSNVTHALRPMGTLRGHVAKSRAPAPSTVHVQPQSLHPPAPASTTTGLSRKKSLSDIFAQIVAPGKPASTIQSITSGRRPASTVNRWTTSQPADDKRKGNPSGGPSKPHMYPLIGTPTVERRNSLGSLGISDVDDQRQDQLSRDDSLLRDQVRLLLSNMVDTPQGTPSLSPDTRQQHKQQKHKQNKKPPPVKIPTQHRGDSLGLRSNGDMSDILTSLFQKDDEDVLSIPASQRHDDQSILGEFHTECVLPSATSSLPTKHRKQDNNVNVATTDTVAHSPGPLLSPGQYFARHSGPLGDLEGNVDEWLRPNFFFKNKMQKENPAVITNSLTAMLSANNNRKPPVKRPSSSVKANPIWSVPSSPPPPPPLIATVAASATAPTPMAPTAVNNPQQTPVKSNDPPSKENPSLDWLYATTMKPPRVPQPNPSAVPFKLNTTKTNGATTSTEPIESSESPIVNKKELVLSKDRLHLQFQSSIARLPNIDDNTVLAQEEFQLSNTSDRGLPFELAWPGFRFDVSPAYGLVPAHGQVKVTVTLRRRHLPRTEPDDVPRMLSSANLMIICEGINVREMRVRVSAQDQPPASMETTDKQQQQQQQQQQTRSPSSHGSPSRSNGAIHRNRLPEVKELAIQPTNKENNKLETRRLRSNTVTTNGQLSHQLHKQKQQQHANGNAWYDGVDGADSRLFDNNPMDIAKQTTWPMKQEPNLVTDINNDINRAVTGMTANTTNTQFTQATTSYQQQHQQQHQQQQHSLSANMITIDSDSSRRADAAIIMQGPIKLRFPDTAISDECQLRLRLCNPTQAPMRIHTRCEVEPQGGSLPVSFTCPVSGVYIHPRSYVIVPIIFRPTVVGRHRGQAIIRVSGGSHRIQVQLQGTAVTSNWIT